MRAFSLVQSLGPRPKRRVASRTSPRRFAGRMRLPDASAGSVGRRGGFTLVELIVAIMILVVGVLGLASTAAVVSRMIGSGGYQTVAANVAQTRFEKLRSARCGALASGTATTRKVTEAWRVQQVSARLYFAVDSISFTDMRSTRHQGYRSFVQCTP